MNARSHTGFPRLLRQLWFQVVLATLIGILLGHFWPQLGQQMKPFGDAFIALVRMIIAHPSPDGGSADVRELSRQ